MGGDKFDVIDENPFYLATKTPLSTFSIDVDTASYSKVRSFLLGQGRLPRKDAVRIEELVNYFDYAYAGPASNSVHPIVASAAMAICPWNGEHRLARVAVKGVEPENQSRPKSNLVFLVDASGSMQQANKLPLLKQALDLLSQQLTDSDRVSIVVYAGAAGVVLDGATGAEPDLIADALKRIEAGGSTNGGAGISQAYAMAREYFIEDGDNRVILCSDGDFNVGVTGTDSLIRMVEQEAKGGVFLTVLGFGMGNHNDAMMEQISGRGNGNYFFIDTLREAEKVLVHDLRGTLTTIAKDVKIQIEFNPNKVAAYRLIGYENRMLEAQDFNDDAKDAGEVGVGHCVTALYEIVPKGTDLPAGISEIDPLRYQQTASKEAVETSDEWMAIKLRYKRPSETDSQKFEFVVLEADKPFEQADADLKFAAAVASFGMLLRESAHRGDSTFDSVLEIASENQGEDEFGFRAEFCQMVRVAKDLAR
jgi:Ca-activated chloride channel homolog